MTVDITEETPGDLSTYATVPTAFEVSTVLDDNCLDALRRGGAVRAVALDDPYVKDYDSYSGNHPTEWPARFDLSMWGFLGAYLGTTRVGSAAIIIGDEQIELLKGRSDTALLWDLRVAPDARRRGVGGALLDRAEALAVKRGARWLRVETQQVNVPACRFYNTHGFALENVGRDAYPELPDELQLVWLKQVAPELAALAEAR